MRQVAFIAVLGLAAVSLSGCQSFREAAGLEKIEPDEFAVATRAPLVVPPDYNLRPPTPGAPPTNTLDPTEAAAAAVLGQQPVATNVQGPLSVSEQALLNKAGATSATSGIRNEIAADNRNMQTADQSFTNALLFGLTGSPDNSHTAIDANAEKARLDAQQGSISTVETGAPAAAQQQDTISRAPAEKKDSGWFSGMFDGIF